MSDYPLGATVRYTGRQEVAQDDTGPMTATGLINGEPYRDDDGEVEFVPVWTPRDHDREDTTILVHVSNIIAVEPWKEAQ